MNSSDPLYATDAYLRTFEGPVVAIDREGVRVALGRTAFYPGGGGQPHDLGSLRWMTDVPVTKVTAEQGLIWHTLGGVDPDALPDLGQDVSGTIDWDRRHVLMRTHTALHMLCGVIWSDYGVPVTGGNMEPGSGRLDFELDAMSAELGARVEARINDEIAMAREIRVGFLPREEADRDPALIRIKANLIPTSVDPLRIIDIVGLDRQADGGTHVASTAEVGHVRVTKTESKGRGNKRIRLAVSDAPAPGGQSVSA